MLAVALLQLTWLQHSDTGSFANLSVKSILSPHYSLHHPLPCSPGEDWLPDGLLPRPCFTGCRPLLLTNPP